MYTFAGKDGMLFSVHTPNSKPYQCFWFDGGGVSWGLYPIVQDLQIFLGHLLWSLEAYHWCQQREKCFISEVVLFPIKFVTLPIYTFMDEVRKTIFYLGKEWTVPINNPLNSKLASQVDPPDSDGFNWRLGIDRSSFLFSQQWTTGNWAHWIWRQMKSMSNWSPCVLPQEGQTVLWSNHLVKNTCSGVMTLPGSRKGQH